MEVNPISIILVFLDSKGDRLLYRYPYHQMVCVSATDGAGTEFEVKKKSNYAIQDNEETPLYTQTLNLSNSSTAKGQLHSFRDEALSTLFAVKSQLCYQKFELKINDIRFVSHPTLIQRKVSNSACVTVPTASKTVVSTPATATVNSSLRVNPKQQAPQQMLMNIVFALHAHASYSIVKCYHDLSRRLGLTLKIEEQRAGYVSDEIAEMIRTHDEVSTQQLSTERAYDLLAERCSLAQTLKSVYHDLCTTGLLCTVLNQNITLHFCLPHKAHQIHKKSFQIIDPEEIARRTLKPYHGILLLVDFAELLDCVPPVGVRMLLQMMEVYSPLISLQNIASDAELHIEHVFKIVAHLVYWAKATIIYPLCETNVYVIAPDAQLHTKSHLVEKFSGRFPGISLFEVIADFSLPTSIGHLTTPLQQPARQGILAQMVLWMLQHHLLMQLHTYVQFMPNASDYSHCDIIKNNCFQTASDERSSDNRSCEKNVVRPIEERDRGSNYIIISDKEGSLLSLSSQPLPVPHTGCRSINEERYSFGDSTMSDNYVTQPFSSHKSNMSITVSLSTENENCDSLSSNEDDEKIRELLKVFSKADRAALQEIPASGNIDDLALMVRLYQAGYFKSEHHLEEIVYLESLRRSQLLQLLDKFREILIIYESEDPAISTMFIPK